ncbi:MAG: tRNA (adenosine(37)-N6)-threonylcarbamoyltransferase complex transferase subunit TsaD [Acidobacteria bacterium]|nr:tRNA (adenosine(37)-N6)-threonylcarbamoyltransferase complex transferase subunit TsaD [Acidobacteriota bacterium]
MSGTIGREWGSTTVEKQTAVKGSLEYEVAGSKRPDGRHAVILGIETSCDETAAAVVEDGARIRSSVIASQYATHGTYEGVVPELASREHVRNIVPVVRQAVEQASMDYADVDAIAVTVGPGLAGALLVGLTYAKSLALALERPLIAVNHLEGHIHAVLLEERLEGRPEPEFPALSLVVSGGHTLLALTELLPGPATNGSRAAVFTNRILGRTRDDAAGEAFDKVAKLLGYGYPGGPVIDRLAPHGNPHAIEFTKPKMKGNPLDFSFSGIKTAVLRYVQAHGLIEEINSRRAWRQQNPMAGKDELLARSSPKTLDLIASFRAAVVNDLVDHCRDAAEQEGVNSIFVTGGVAANALLRERLNKGAGTGLPVYFPRLGLSTDNAAMIAAAAFPKFLAREFAGLDITADATLALG